MAGPQPRRGRTVSGPPALGQVCEHKSAVPPAQCSLRSEGRTSLVGFQGWFWLSRPHPCSSDRCWRKAEDSAGHRSAKHRPSPLWGSQKRQHCNVQVQADAPRPRQGLWAPCRGCPGASLRVWAATSSGAFPVAVNQHTTRALQRSPGQDLAFSVFSTSCPGPALVL